MKKAGQLSKEVDWGTIDHDLYYYAAGFNGVWGNLCWGQCDYIMGIDNVGEKHWNAYRYNFLTKTVEIYDSMLGAMQQARIDVAQRHATIAPSLYNISFARQEDMVDPDVPFNIVYVDDVPQQANWYDCDVHAVKFVQCLAMQKPYNELLQGNFSDYRKVMAIDLVKWLKATKGGKVTYEELEIAA